MNDQAAIRRLCIRRMYAPGAPFSADEIAHHYKLDVADVLEALRHLKRSRIVRDRRRNGRRVWEPWD